MWFATMIETTMLAVLDLGRQTRCFNPAPASRIVSSSKRQCDRTAAVNTNAPGKPDSVHGEVAGSARARSTARMVPADKRASTARTPTDTTSTSG